MPQLLNDLLQSHNDIIPAPEQVAQYLYDNRHQKPSLQVQMGLQSDKEKLDDIVAITRLAARARLDFRGASYRKQRPEILEEITKEVLKECRDIRKYKNGWPVSRYIYIYLKNHHPKKAKASYRPGPGRHSVGYTKGPSPELGPLNEDSLPSSSRPRPGSARVPSPSSRRSSPLPPLTNHSSPSPSIGREAPLPPQPPSPPSHTNSRAVPELETPEPSHRGHTRHVVSKPEPASGAAIKRFLVRLRFPAGDVERLVRLFRDIGIETQEYLEMLAGMGERDAWLQELREGGALSEIQMRVLRQGLNQLLRELDVKR
ncbi:hypothetical protein C8Q79DRAFT_994760 [Trametes meyenii]|nr:hypothetical protein C8Q79DRAFT_994760 [Trametes meyenii]